MSQDCWQKVKTLGKIIEEETRVLKITRFGSFWFSIRISSYFIVTQTLFRWYLKLKCANCGEIPDKWQYVDQTEKQPLKGGRGEACAVIKCKVKLKLSETFFYSF